MAVPIRATYRLQLHAGFPLSRVRALVPYLSRLGISHVHCSPLLQARKGSTHGYDVTDPSRLNPELGTEEDLAALVAELRAKDMGLVLDIVPNHMAASSENPAWEDVLMHGPASRFARWFDVEWRAPERELRFRVLIPVLGDLRARVLQAHEISLVLEDGRLRARYYEHSFPLDPATMTGILNRAAGTLERTPARAASQTLREISQRLQRLPRRTSRSPAGLTRRREVAATELERLRDLCDKEPEVAHTLSDTAREFGRGAPGIERLRRLLDAQVYRLVYWRRAARELNYRRFFDVNDLVALHMEDPEVFAQTHGLVLQWKERGWIDGFRIDHPDGLLDPAEYLRRLAAAAFPDAAGPAAPTYLEKILAHDERLRDEWPVAGTTGYDFLNQAETLFLQPDGCARIEEEYRRIIRQPLEFGAIARLAKRRVLESSLSAGVRRLADRLLQLAGPEPPAPGLTPHALRVAIVETIASLPVYRTYLSPATPVAEGEDGRLLQGALGDARVRGRATGAAMDLLSAALLGSDRAMRSSAAEGFRLRFVQRFQQLSGPAMAKGVEDTAFYSFAPLLSRNEVGGGPERSLESAVADFHRTCRDRAEHWPRSLLAVTTHDTKRTADVRSRLDVLTEIPAEWQAAMERWRTANQVHKRTVGNRRDPDPNTVYHILQALVGLWPATPIDPSELPDETTLAELRERLTGYGIKAAREAKLRTSWTDPEPDFEEALTEYIAAILCSSRSAGFLQDLSEFVGRISALGHWNALSRTLLHLTAPGVPDLYQGDELWNLALVDPDNRREVDFERRIALLEQMQEMPSTSGSREFFLKNLLEHAGNGRLKLYLVMSVLAARREHPGLFLSGSYGALAVQGPAAQRVISYGRKLGGMYAMVLAPRLLGSAVSKPDEAPVGLPLWQETFVSLPAGWPEEWRCRLAGTVLRARGGRISVAEAFQLLPLSLLLS